MAGQRKREMAPDPQEEERARVRREAGIETLTEGEELIDAGTFSRLHAQLATGSGLGNEDGAALAERESDELLLEEVATELPGATGPARGASSPPADSGELADLERELLAAGGRDEAARIALRIARYYARACALFVVNRGIVAGLCGAGEGLDRSIEGVVIPAAAECLITEPLASGSIATGPAPASGVARRVLKALGRNEVAEIAVAPVTISARVVNLLYVDNGGDPIAETSLAALRALCTVMARVYERLIRERKREGGSRAIPRA